MNILKNNDMDTLKWPTLQHMNYISMKLSKTNLVIKVTNILMQYLKESKLMRKIRYEQHIAILNQGRSRNSGEPSGA